MEGINRDKFPLFIIRNNNNNFQLNMKFIIALLAGVVTAESNPPHWDTKSVKIIDPHDG